VVSSARPDRPTDITQEDIMPGEYENVGGGPPRIASLLTVLNGQGPPIRSPSIAGYQLVSMDQQAGGPTAGAVAPGVWTQHVTACIAVGVMQHNGIGGWMSYYFAHLRGGMWTPTEQGLFNAVITNPLNAYVVMMSNAFAGMEIVLDQMNAGNPAGNIPLANLLKYKSQNQTFAMRLADSSIGQIPS
jgi:hypothetical protein